jgi:hypothetical protein
MGVGLGYRLRTRFGMALRMSLALPVVVLATAAAAAQGRTDRLELSTITNSGHVVLEIDARMRTELRHANASTRAMVMAVRHEKTFVEFGRTGKGNCFGIKRRAATRFSFTCWTDFPSPAHPILDESVFGADLGEPIHLIEAQGFAADGVASIAVEDAAGTVLSQTPVIDNVYSLETFSKSGVRLIAFDAAGRVVFAVPH